MIGCSYSSPNPDANWRSIAGILNEYADCYLVDTVSLTWSTRNSFIAWASDFYGHNDMDIVSLHLWQCFSTLMCWPQLEVYVPNDWVNCVAMASCGFLRSGNGDLTYEEQKSHFTAWALMKSPLLIGTGVSSYYPFPHWPFTWHLMVIWAQLSTIPERSLSILMNTEIIDINQDSVIGTSIMPFRWGINVCSANTTGIRSSLYWWSVT